MKYFPFEIPYRLETVEDITKALHSNLLNIGSDYLRLLHWAEKTTLQHPPAFIKAKNKVTKDFIKIDEEKIRDVKITFSQVANLPSIDQYPLIMSRFPWINDIICHENLFQFFHSFPLEIRKLCLLEHLPDSLSSMYDIILAIRKFLRRELVVYVKAQKTSRVSLTQLKQSLVALTVFEPSNEDVLHALKTKNTKVGSSLHQNAMAEILFARLPQTINGLLNKNAKNLVQKLSLKMSKLNFSSRHIMNLMGYVNQTMNSDDFSRSLDRIDGVTMRMSINPESKDKFHNYIESLKKNIDRAPSVYRALFLSSELETYQKMHRPTKIMQSEENVTEKIVKHYTLLNTMNFYPAKDFLDFFKGRISHDCTDFTETELCERQLLTPEFFNIRIFVGGEWIGNIYMLDFCNEHASLVIDRIQIPRWINISYYQFFDYLRDVLIEMFEDVHYEYILMPLRISNHGTIQDIFNKYRKNMSKTEKFFDIPYTAYFESLRGRKSYYVLHKNSKA